MYNFQITVPFYNGEKHIHKLLKSIPEDILITVVDDDSDTPLRNLPYNNVEIIKSTRKGYFTGACNLTFNRHNKDILILNQDTYFTGNKWIEQINKAIEEGYSIIGEQIKGTRQDGSTYAHGTFFYIKREVIDSIGTMDEKYYPLWGSNYEYSLRAARAGFKIKPLPIVEDFIHERKPTEQFGSSIQTLLKNEPNNRAFLVRTPPLVSVVIPCYNFSSWLESTVNSLIGGKTDLGEWKQQTFGGFEVIIVDDGSTDNSPEVIESLCDSWKGVRSIRLDRPRDQVVSDLPGKEGRYIGKVGALNAGISSAYGKYIMILDADDMVAPERLERFVDTIERNPDRFIFDKTLPFISNWDGEVHDNFILNTLKRSPNVDISAYPSDEPLILKQQSLPDYNLEFVLYKNTIHNSIMFSKSNWKKVGGYPERFVWGREDWAMNVKLMEHCICPLGLDYNGLYYRRDGQNRTNINTGRNWMNVFRKQMRDEFSKLYNTIKPDTKLQGR